MKNRYGFTKKDKLPPSDAKIDENSLRVLDSESNCTAWKYPFYAVDKDGRYVLGFDDEHETDTYCAKNKYVKLTLGQACMCTHKPNIYKNWKSTYPTEGLL